MKIFVFCTQTPLKAHSKVHFKLIQTMNRLIKWRIRWLIKWLIGFAVVFFVYRWIDFESISYTPRRELLEQQSSAHALYATFIRLLSAFFFVDPEVFYPEQVDFEQGNTRVFSQFNKTTVQHAQGVNTNTETLLIWRTIERHRAFTMLSNYILSDKRLHDAPTFETTVTYITQATCDFLHHSVQVCRRFDGPISLAVYSPGSEFLLTVKLIFFLRQCTHPCVRQNITWHLVFDDRHRPDLLDVQQTWQEFLHKSGFKMAAIDCNESFASFFNRLKNKHFSRNQSFPINLLRNFARKHARSRYGLVSDIDLYPSLNVVSMFRRLLDQERDGRLEIVDSSKPHVYVLPVYEVKTGDVKTPKTKDELVEMLNTGSAIALSKRKRESRHKFVDQESWINATIKPGELNIFQKVKPKPTGWEPFFIGTNDDPFFDEKLTWGGRQDRTAQVFKMCLKDYDFFILDQAFLVHVPGDKQPEVVQNQTISDQVTIKTRLK